MEPHNSRFAKIRGARFAPPMGAMPHPTLYLYMTFCLRIGHLTNQHSKFARETLNDIVVTGSLTIFNECVTKTFEIPKWRFR